jgi:hypothetical protein
MAKKTDEQRLRELQAKIDRKKKLEEAKKAVEAAKAVYAKVRGK